MNKICVFAGTTEGRTIIEHLCREGADVTACVATKYGQALLPEAENLTVSARRLSGEEILELLKAEHFELVIDATHPYAAAVTENVSSACAASGTDYIRVLRDGGDCPEGTVWAETVEDAVAFLAKTEGKILLTTGSKDLARFSALPDFAERVYARVLPMEESLALCREAGLKPAHIAAMQGPFSEEMNTAMLRFCSASFLVTKESGASGGFPEKAAAARAAGAKLVVIGRPEEREGVSPEEALRIFKDRFGPNGGSDRHDKNSKKIVTQGLPDEAFLRIDRIPMTKSEVRAVILSKLMLTEDSVCWDIGAGTGSVAVEMGLRAALGKVYAIERSEDAAALIGKNARRLGASNVTVVTGTAPEALGGLPAPTHAFIGGSSGNMEEIIGTLLAANPGVRIAATAVTLETAAALTGCIGKFGFTESEAVQLSVARSRKAGAYHLMAGQNPVWLFVFRR